MDVLRMIRTASGSKLQPQPAGDDSVIATAVLLQMESSGLACWVSLFDGDPVKLPCQPTSYAGITTVSVLMQGGKPVHVLGPAGVPVVDSDSKDDAKDQIQNPTASLKTVRGKSIRPAWSGTWRAIRGAYDRWNTATHGGRSDLYQGANGSSGALQGVAVYGGGFVNLRAVEILKATVTLIPNGSIGAGLSVPVTIQAVTGGGTPAGAPQLTGPTVTSPGLTAGKTTSLSLPAAICELLRSGAAGGLAIVGAQYQGIRGTSHPAGMAVAVDYTTNK